MTKRLKILIFTGDFQEYVAPVFYYFLCELEKITDLTVWHESGDINNILDQLKEKPDFIYFNEYGEMNSPVITGLKDLEIPFAIQLFDLHYQINKRKRAIREENIKHIFTVYRDSFHVWYKEFSDRMYWLPHHINTEIFKDYGLKKEYNYLLMGAMSRRTYPLRNMIVDRMKDNPGFVHHKHPGYRNIKDHEKNVFVREAYAKEINKAKIFLTGNSKYNYPLGKNFEVPACNTLLLAPPSNELKDLGFIPEVHYIPINKENFEEKAKYYLQHKCERERIARQGMEMVHERHSTSKRADQFVKVIKKIISDEKNN